MNRERFAREIKKTCSELKSYNYSKGESIKLETRNFEAQDEHLKKETINLKYKTEIAKLPKSTLKSQPNVKKLNESIQEHNEATQSINLQHQKQDNNYVRITIDRTQDNLKEYEDKIKEQLNSDKAVDWKIR